MSVTAPAITLTDVERAALDAFMKGKRKWYTAKRIAAMSGLNPHAVEKAFARFVSLDFMWRSDFKAEGKHNRYAMSDEGVEFHDTLPKARKPKAKGKPKGKPQPKGKAQAAERGLASAETVEQDVAQIVTKQIAADKALVNARKALKQAEKAARAVQLAVA
jgi:hypothetical protein